VGLFVRAGRLLLLLLPTVLLLLGGQRLGGTAGLILGLGALFQALGCALALWTRGMGREPLGPALIMLYVIALSWMLLGASNMHDWFLYLAQAILLVIPVFTFGVQSLRDSGATAMRRARLLADRLAARRNWPADLQEVRLLPEVKALRESLHIDATPALRLLANPHPAVRTAALAALEYRPTWRAGQPQVVLQLAQRAPEPEVRAAAINALANVDDRLLVEPLAELMHDPSPLVRQTATEALLWNSEQRWEWVRHIVRLAMGNPVTQDDGPLKLDGPPLTPEAVADLQAWTAEKGSLALRAALTLGVYYGKQFAAGASPELAAGLRKHVLAPGTPSLLRLQLTLLLREHGELTIDDLKRLIDPSMPAPVRIIAADTLLSEENSPEATATLHDLARLPNREIALATAEVVQKHLGIDLGLQRGQPAPPIHSRAAADIARRLLAWANQHEVDDQGAMPLAPSPSPMPVRRAPSPSAPSSSSRVDLG
jgi:HEAT repeat protein